MVNKKIKFSILIPVFNEENVIGKVVINLHNFLKNKLYDGYEIIVINDGSTDNTDNILKNIELENFKTFTNPYNKGYGSALKLGAQNSKADFLIFYDGDGQHNPKDILKLIKNKENYDMVIGSRQKYQGPMWRQPGKKIINVIANYLVNYKIPDLNSGLRLVRKSYFEKFEHLYPNGFSLTTTISLAFIKYGYNLKYIPIEINKRIGKSTVGISDGFKAITLVLRMIMLFSPLRIFLPLGFIIFIFGILSLIIDIFNKNLTDATTLLFLTSIIICSFGLLSDQIAAIRREIK